VREVTRDLSAVRPLRDLARHCGASERTLAWLFRTEMVMTYPQWRNNVRVHQAMIYLAEGIDGQLHSEQLWLGHA
jgi:AraC-like DNA-binding protein